MEQARGFLKTLFVEVTRAGIEVMSNLVTAEVFMTALRSVTVVRICERSLEIERGGKIETLRITITDPSQLVTIIDAMRSAKKINLVLTGYESNRTGKREVLTSKIMEVSLAA